MGLFSRLLRRSRPAIPEPAAVERPALPVPLLTAASVAAMSDAELDEARATVAAALEAVQVAKASGSTPITEAPGRPGFSVYGGYLDSGEKSPDMNGSRKWTRFREMVNNVAIVGAPFRRYLTLGGAPKVTVPPWKAHDADAPEDDDVMMARFAEDQLANLATPWATVQMTALSSRWTGSTIQVWQARKIKGGEFDGMIGLADVVDRPMHTIEQWLTDPQGNVTGVVQRAPQDATEYRIERERMVWSRDIPLTDSPAGVGILRQVAEAVRELEALFKQLHQGLETDLGGIPVVYAPIEALKKLIGSQVTKNGPPFSMADFNAAIADLIKFAKNHVRTKETGLVLDSGAHKGVDNGPSGPPLYKVEVLQAGGKSHDALLEAIKQKLWEIAIVTGFEYLLLGADGSGSLAMAKIKTNDAYRLVSSALEAWMGTIQRDILRPLWALNGRDPMQAPRPTWDRQEFKDVGESLQGVLGPLSSAGVTIDRNDKLVNEAIQREGWSPLEADDPGDLAEERQVTADRLGLDLAGKGKGPEGVIEPTDDLNDED